MQDELEDMQSVLRRKRNGEGKRVGERIEIEVEEDGEGEGDEDEDGSLEERRASFNRECGGPGYRG
jgi:hypothetical protein